MGRHSGQRDWQPSPIGPAADAVTGHCQDLACQSHQLYTWKCRTHQVAMCPRLNLCRGQSASPCSECPLGQYCCAAWVTIMETAHLQLLEQPDSPAYICRALCM